MVDQLVVTDDPPPTSTEFDTLSSPPLDPQFFSSDIDTINNNNFISDLGSDLVFEDNFDFDLTFDGIDDFYLPPETENFVLPDGFDPAPFQVDQPCSDHSASPLNSTSPKSNSSIISGDKCIEVDRFLNCVSSESGECSQNSGDLILNVSSTASGNCGCELSGEPVSSHGSGNRESGISEGMNSPSHSHSDNSDRDVSSKVFVDQKVKVEKEGKNCMSKRKKELGEPYLESRTTKYRKSSLTAENENSQFSVKPENEEEEKKKARLMRNRESAQLSRQRKKHYVEELEDKVRNMHSTITDLNSKISYIMAENASLRQQLNGGGICPPPPPGIYPHPPMAPMAYPWMTCSPYVMKPQGSVPLVPIPKWKPQQTTAPKVKKSEVKKAEGKTKKIASISFLGLLFFIFLFGGLVPIIDLNFSGITNKGRSGLSYVSDGFYGQHRGRVLTVSGHLNESNDNVGVVISSKKIDCFGGTHNQRGCIPGEKSEFGTKAQASQLPGNASEPLVASLYVPRNDKLVKIDGNLIIHSVLASEEATAFNSRSKTKNSKETGLTVSKDLASALAIPDGGVYRGRHAPMYRNPTERQKALASGSADALNDHMESNAADGKLQQWFQEGLAGPFLSSGMCTEVFQFNVSPVSASGAIIPASPVSNVTAEHQQNTTHLNKGKNRRILGGLPVPLAGSNYNITKEHVRRDRPKENFQGNRSMVVSVLVDPREAADTDVDGVMKPKLPSRIFVVLLTDSAKYVTYSCMLPLSVPHLVTT